MPEMIESAAIMETINETEAMASMFSPVAEAMTLSKAQPINTSFAAVQATIKSTVATATTS
ncbi:MAG: hypothetical protein CMJ78_09720 [Planctomycetaceae bacterium]|nr:hypothetical protein [Planctomycetaceae bacterium]